MVYNTYVIETGQVDKVTKFKDIGFSYLYPIPTSTPQRNE